jgi:hypothetical protein
MIHAVEAKIHAVEAKTHVVDLLIQNAVEIQIHAVA